MATPRMLPTSRPRVGVPLSVCPVDVLNGGAACAVVPRVRIGSGIFHCPAPLLRCPTLHCVCCHSIGGLGGVFLWQGCVIVE